MNFVALNATSFHSWGMNVPRYGVYREGLISKGGGVVSVESADSVMPRAAASQLDFIVVMTASSSPHVRTRYFASRCWLYGLSYAMTFRP